MHDWALPALEGDYLGDLNRVKISDNFYLSEFECHGGSCCGYSVKVHPDVLVYAEAMRSALSEHRGVDTPLVFVSAYRCPIHNQREGGKHHSLDPRDPRNSFHCQGKAGDPDSPGVSKVILARIAHTIWPRVGFYWAQRPRGSVLVLHCDIADPARLNIPARWGDAWPQGFLEANGR